MTNGKVLVFILLVIALFFVITNFDFNNYEIIDLENFTLDCHKSGKPWGIQRCKYIPKDPLRNVSYIPDINKGELNEIVAPFTQEEFLVELIDIETDEAWDFEFLPDGSILSTQREGKIIHYNNGKTKVVHELNPILLFETGLLGLAIDPDFSQNNYVYLQYTYELEDPSINVKTASDKGGIKALNKISRFTFTGSALQNEYVLLDNIQASAWHAGGRLEFGPDGKLYATTGDGNELLKPQDIEFLGGKILRLNKDGTIPEDNPFEDSYVYSLGHRNPQGIAWNIETEIMYESEHGPISYDEINIIESGKNYGWGSYKCDVVKSKIVNENTEFPIICIDDYTIAPSGLEFINDKSSPWYGSLFVASLRARHVHRYKFEDNEVILDEIFFVSEGLPYNKNLNGKLDRRIRDIEYNDGSLYILGDYFGMAKLTPIINKKIN